jgi:peptidylprolyl isomerase
MSLVKEGHSVKVHYKGTLDDGTEFDNSRSRGQTLEFEVGTGQMIKGFDTALVGMGLGEVKTFTLSSDDAYGPVHDEAFRDFPREAFGEDVELEVDGVVHGSTPTGQPMIAKVTAISEETVTLDLNHPLAGKDLTFEVELLEIVE